MEKELDTSIITNEMKDFFFKRTKQHIDRVINNMVLMEGYENLTINQLRERGELHDASKYQPPELEPYIWLTWYHKCKQCNIEFNYPNGIQEKVKDAIHHHLHCNRHHPESHLNQNDMSTLDIVEMVCDWSAISQELNQGSCKGYASSNISKFSFSSDKLDFIFKTINEFDTRYSKIKSLNH